jgi:hypothetical protein
VPRLKRCALAGALFLLPLVSSGEASSGSDAVKNGAVTVFVSGLHARPNPTGCCHGGQAVVDAIGRGWSRTLWHCPGGIWCGQPVSMGWSRDGRRLALTLDEIGGTSGYVGLHVIDVVTGHDRQIPAGAPATTAEASFAAYRPKIFRRLGCAPPTDLAWSPDGSRLAYRCPSNGWMPATHGDHINVIRIDGTGYRTVPTPTPAFWPSWSPDGRLIAFSSGLAPARSSLYTAALDGTQRHLLAHAAAAPAWSPDGQTIAYESACGVRLVTPGGQDVTPSGSPCGIPFAGRPVWSPDGSMLAIQTSKAIYELRADGSDSRLLTRRAGPSWYGQQPGRPAWRARL